jgi:LemA protein
MRNNRVGFILIGFFALIILCGTFCYNSLVNAHQRVKNGWSQVETQYQRRYDLIPNLLNSTKAYMKHEKAIFEELAKARAGYMQAESTNQKLSSAFEIEGVLTRFIALAENYPDLKANMTIQQLMDELAGTENRISCERMRYNQEVMRYNSLIFRFPSNLMAKLFSFHEESYVKSKESANEPVKVSFD